MPSRCWIGLLALVLSCEDKPKPSDAPPVVFSASPQAASDAGLDGSAARRVLSELRKNKLDLAARRVPAQRLAFSKGKVAQLSDGALVVRDTRQFAELSRVALPSPRRVVMLRDGALLAAGAQSLFLLEPREKKPIVSSRVPLFPDSRLVTDRVKERRFWVLHGFDPTLYGYDVDETGALSTLDFIELEGWDKNAFAALKDGSFLYTTAAGFTRFFARGKTTQLSFSHVGKAWRILTTRRIDRFWVAHEDGAFVLLSLAGARIKEVRRLQLPSAFDVASKDTAIAVLRLERGSDKERHFAVEVYDDEGKLRFADDLPIEASLVGEAWVKQATEDRTLALSQSESLVAVGGPTALFVWDYAKKKRVWPKE